MWELTTSHSTLRLRLEENGRVGNLQIACLGPISISGPVEWNDCEIEVARCADGFVIAGSTAGVRIVTEAVEIAENAKPLNAFTAGTKAD